MVRGERVVCARGRQVECHPRRCVQFSAHAPWHRAARCAGHDKLNLNSVEERSVTHSQPCCALYAVVESLVLIARMRLLVIYCHPVRESFCAALRDVVVQTATADGHDVRLLDLYADGFNPVMSEQERIDYDQQGLNERPVKDHLSALQWCEGLIFVYPTWWMGQPAMLKGWLDRVWVPHATFIMPTEKISWEPLMTNVKLLGVVTTLGSPWWWWTFGVSAPGRKILMRSIRTCCARDCKTFWVALHRMDSVTPKARQHFIERVRRRIKRIGVSQPSTAR